MSYWIENRFRCPKDSHELKATPDAAFLSSRIYGYSCPYCREQYYLYVNADIAVKSSILPDFLSNEEQQKINLARKKKQEEIERIRTLQAKAKKELEEIEKQQAQQRLKEKQEKERQLTLQRVEEEKKRAELLVKKETLTERIKSILETDYLNSIELVSEANSEKLFPESELRSFREDFVADWFSEHMQDTCNFPDKHQLAAIGALSKNVEVVARAGSGKTTTIVNRFRFLVEHCKVDPSSILLLAFNRNAVQELRNRTEKILLSSGNENRDKPHILTIHALAHSIVRPQEKLIFDEGDYGSNELSRTVQAIIDKRLKDIIWGTRIRALMLEYFKSDWEKIEEGGYHLSKEEQLLYRRSLQKQSLNGDYVKSYGEKLIANILFEHGVKYYYESAIRWADGIYRPDFTVKLPGKKTLIIEYFGLAGDPSYDEQIERKRAFWMQKENYTLYELYPEDIAEGEEHVVSQLRDALSSYGVSFKKLTEEEIWKRIKDRAIDNFTRTVVGFIGRCRKKELSVSELRKQIIDYDPQEAIERQFHKISFSIYKEYLNTLFNDNKEDFDGLISRACTCIQNGQTDFDKRSFRGSLKDLRYIMVDEYQDFSYLFDKLLNTVRFVCPQAGVFCVGDDWQAINAFAGSDVMYFQDFNHRYNDAQRFFVKKNYRSAKRIVSAGCNLMSDGSGDSQIKANSSEEGTVAIGYYDQFVPSIDEQNVFHTDLLTPAVLRIITHFLRQGKNVVLLFRTNDRLPLSVKMPNEIRGKQRERFTAHVKSFFPPDLQTRISSSTTHQYKGKEEDAVIIMDAMNSFYPLIHPTWIFMQVFGDSLDKLIEDERHLFYVAVTRAKTDLVILTTIKDKSPFLSELGEIGTLHWDGLPAFEVEKREARIEITNQKGYGSSPTKSIKEELKSAGFAYYGKTNSWFRNIHELPQNLDELLNEPWAKQADHVQVTIFDENDERRACVLIVDGEIQPVAQKNDSI